MKRLTPFALVAIFLITGCRPGDLPPNQVHSPDDIPGRMIGVMNGTSAHRFIEDGFRHETAGAEVLFAMLLSGAIDAAVMERVTAERLMSGNRNITLLSEPLIEYDLRIAVARENVQLLNAVNSALATLAGNGTLSSLHDKYFLGSDFTLALPETEENHSSYLRVAVPHNFPPFAYTDGYGELTGLDIDVARAVFNILGIEMQIIALDHDELITAVWFGRADLALGFTPNDANEEFVNFSNPYAQSTQAIIVRR